MNNRKEKMILANSSFSVVESYKAIRANLSFAVNKKGCKRVMVCSSVPGDGKSTTAINIAVSIAQNNEKVILLDCDLRKNRAHWFLNMKNTVGVSNILGGMSTIGDSIRETDYPNLSVITAGTIPPNPAELLASDAMVELLDSLEKEYDYIVLDTPPINIVSDALALTKLVDGTIFVVRQEVTLHHEVKEALKTFEFAGAKILGIVINGSYERSSGYKYGNKYGYKYGNDYVYGDSK